MIYIDKTRICNKLEICKIIECLDKKTYNHSNELIINIYKNYRIYINTESLIRDVVLRFLVMHNKITPLQHGCRPGYSCATQLLMVSENFYIYIWNCILILTVFIWIS